MIPGFKTTVDDDQAKVFGADRKPPKTKRKRADGSDPPPERDPRAWRDPQNGELIIDVPFHPGFNAALKATVPASRRLWKAALDGSKGGIWLVWPSEALPTEDLLEEIFPEIVIDYQGWNPANDQLVGVDRLIVADDPPF